MKHEKGLQRLTVSEAKLKRLLNHKNITPNQLERLSKAETSRLMELLTEKFNGLKGTERDKFYQKIEPIVSECTKTQIWENNHIQITRVISTFIQEYGRMPTKSEIANKSGLSRQTIHKHLKEYTNHPQYLEQLEQFRFLTSKLLAKVYQFALNGDTMAAKLYFNLLGFMNNGSNTLIQNQNNFIQINSTVLSQQTIQHLNPEQLNSIEAILKTALPKPAKQLK